TAAGARARGLRMSLIAQADTLPEGGTIRDVLDGAAGADDDWARDGRYRAVADGLLGGVRTNRFPRGLDTPIGPLSGGERRRIGLARVLIEDPDLLMLDEPTNHLDVEGVQWLADHLAARRGALVVVTHDRWFLDAVCQATWDVADRSVHRYEGGYAAAVLARAERERVAAVREERRQNLLRKELAWLRRGPPARTSKPRFRIDAANAMIADEPEARDRAELVRFATRRLGRKVIEMEDVSVAFGDAPILRGATWRLGPGDRAAVVGVNGSGKSTLMDVLAGARAPDSGTVSRGATVRVAHLTQDAAEIPGDLRVLDALEDVRLRTVLPDGREVTAGQLCERFGFRGTRAGTLVRDLSGGERRRVQLMRLLMEEPNVLLLDEPTNDLDIDTLTALEDLLDGWPGTLVVVSHDRYFVERVCDDVHAFDAGGIRHLPGGVDQYLAERREAGDAAAASAPAAPKPASGGGAAHAARKDLARVEREVERLQDAERDLHARMAEVATDPARLGELADEARDVAARRAEAEERWMDLAERAEAG
ncbi:MAG: ABC-F family ATP-binding cassette domain-containing protein, partial [Thermoleophilia bacterium]|nr:ABC-F family ATP-binding cassette domain-containing protein [Thermoleophilia bacterium]